MDEVNINVKEHQVVGTLDRITSPVNIKSVCSKKIDERNIPEGDHSAVRILKGALMAARGSEGSLQPQPAMVGRPRRLLFLRQEQEQPHSKNSEEFSSREKSRRGREGKCFQDEPKPPPNSEGSKGAPWVFSK